MQSLKNIILFLIGFFIFSTSVFAGGWVKTDKPAGCLVWNEYPEPGETATWTGEVVNGKANDGGVLTWYKNGVFTQRYIGFLKDGKKEGRGTYEWADGRIFSGYFLNNLRHGRGVLLSKDGSFENGFWLENKSVSDEDYQKYLDSINSGFKVSDLIVNGIMLEKFYNEYRNQLGEPSAKKDILTEYGHFQDLTFKDCKITIWQPSEFEKKDSWIIKGITITSNNITTARNIKIGDTVDKVVQAYGKTDYAGKAGASYCLDNSGLHAFGSYLYFGFDSKSKDGIISEITISIGFD